MKTHFYRLKIKEILLREIKKNLSSVLYSKEYNSEAEYILKLINIKEALSKSTVVDINIKEFI